MSNNRIYLSSFVSGFLNVFGLGENPSAYFEMKYRRQNDSEKIRKDWNNIGIDIQKSYEQYRSSIETPRR